MKTIPLEALPRPHGAPRQFVPDPTIGVPEAPPRCLKLIPASKHSRTPEPEEVDHLGRRSTRRSPIPSPPLSLPRRLLRASERAMAFVGSVWVLYFLCFDIAVMTSSSMAPTLQGLAPTNGDWILSEKVSYWFRPPQRWEVITFQDADGVRIMKRVVGLPGEAVSLRNHTIYIDRHPISRPAELAHIRYLPLGSLATGRETYCGDGYFVLGDNSKESQDSRFEGSVPSHRIQGRAWCILWPPARIGWVHR